MSNKFANKLKVGLVALLVLSPMFLVAFQPSRQNFSSRYHYALYMSWKKKAAALEKLSAQIGPKSVVQKYRNEHSNLVEVQFDWEKQLIFGQKELIRLSFPKKLQQHKLVLENFLYRLNCSQRIFLENMLQNANLRVKYKQGGLDSLWADFDQNRFETKTIKWQHEKEILKFKLSSYSDKQITIEFPISVKFSVYLDAWQKQTKVAEPKWEATVATSEISRTPEKTAQAPAIIEFLYNTYQQQFRREMVNNKINNIEQFMRTQFPKHKLTKQKNIFYLENDAKFLGLDNFITVKVHQNNDSWQIEAVTSYNLNDNYLKLNRQDSLDVGSLNAATTEQVAIFLPQILYMHRALGTQLFNFLLIPDDVPTTLLVHNGKRQRFDFASYGDLLLRLHQFWQDRQIFFSLQNMRQMNGFIEFKGVLAAVGKEKYDWAEIRFHLNKEYKIDLIMMSLHIEKTIER